MKKQIAYIIAIISFLLFPIHYISLAADLTLPKDTPIKVYFSPDGGCTNAINKVLGQARQEILVQANSFTSAPIAKALLEAHKRGVKVQVILDKSQRTQKYSSATFLKNVGIATFIDSKHAIAHNKIMIIDQEIVITDHSILPKPLKRKTPKMS